VNKKYKETSSLLDVFKVGARVKQIYYDNTTSQREYYGIVIGVKQRFMVVQWDTIDVEPNVMISIVSHIFLKFSIGMSIAFRFIRKKFS
jgi:hypothetical protein